MNKVGLEDDLENMDLGDKTEMQGVADEVFKNQPSRSNIDDEETSACFVSNVVFSIMGMNHRNPVNNFLELKKSTRGWAMENFVRSAGGVQDQRSGGMMSRAWDAMFKRKEG